MVTRVSISSYFREHCKAHELRVTSIHKLKFTLANSHWSQRVWENFKEMCTVSTRKYLHATKQTASHRNQTHRPPSQRLRLTAVVISIIKAIQFFALVAISTTDREVIKSVTKVDIVTGLNLFANDYMSRYPLYLHHQGTEWEEVYN